MGAREWRMALGCPRCAVRRGRRRQRVKQSYLLGYRKPYDLCRAPHPIRLADRKYIQWELRKAKGPRLRFVSSLSQDDRERVFSSVPAGMLMLKFDTFTPDVLAATHSAVSSADAGRATAAFEKGLSAEKYRTLGSQHFCVPSGRRLGELEAFAAGFSA
jgi:hypothetical protein